MRNKKKINKKNLCMNFLVNFYKKMFINFFSCLFSGKYYNFDVLVIDL